MNKYTIIAIILMVVGVIAFIIIKEKSPVSQEKIKETISMKIESPAFQNNGKIPSKYTCDGQNINPPLNIFGIPENTKSLALIMDDPDAPAGVFTHWTVWNINPPIKEIAENSIPGKMEGKTDFGKTGYGGPCPHSGLHHYSFRLYALDTALSISENSDKKSLEAAMDGHVIASAKLIGLYSLK